MLRIHLLGGFRLQIGDEPLTAVDTPRQQVLLAYLLLHRDTPQPRQRLAFLFWPESTEAQAQTNLRQVLHTLRQRLPDAARYLAIDDRSVQWRADALYTLDVADFEQALARAEQSGGLDKITALDQAVACYAGDLLPELYDDWVLSAREHLNQRFVAAMDALIRLHEERREIKPAIAHAQRLLRHDPLHEETYRHLMRLHALEGDRATALRVYHTCATILDRELGVEPNETTQEAYASLLNVATPGLPKSPSPAHAALALRLVGRHAEWATLQRTWRLAATGRSHCVILSGEAGIGKTRLAEELLAWAEQQGIPNASTRCYAVEGSLPLAPVIDWLRSALFQPVLAGLPPAWRSELARLLPELRSKRSDLPPAEPSSERWQRTRLFDALARAILAQRPPLLLVIDDLQWCDPETLEWLSFLLQSNSAARLLIVATLRPEEVDEHHPTAQLRLKLKSTAQLTEIDLGTLAAEETALLAGEVARRSLDRAVLEQLFRDTHGNPLFVVETVRMQVDAGDGAGLATTLAALAPPLPGQAIALPPKIQAMIQARLAKLSPAARELVSLIAVIGRAFTFDLLAHASRGDPDALVRSLDELWQRRIVREQGSNAYDFSHDRIRDVTYAQISLARRRLLHRQIARALEELHAADLNMVAARIAVHYREAGEAAKAADFYFRAAREVQFGFAYAETMTHLQQGLAMLHSQPRTRENIELEIAMLLTRGRFLSAHEGWGSPAAVDAFVAARRLCFASDNLAQLVRAQDYLQIAYGDSGDFPQARALAESNLALASKLADRAEIEGAHGSLGLILLCMGDFRSAREHLDQAAALAAADSTRDPLTYPGAYPHALVLWLLGYPDSALRHLQAVVAAQESSVSPFDRMTGYEYCVMFYHWRREWQEMHLCAQKLLAVTEQYEYETYRWLGELYVTAAASSLGQQPEGSAQPRQSIDNLLAKGIRMLIPYTLQLLAEVHTHAGELAEGIAALDEALAMAEETGEHLWDAETHRLRGDLLVASRFVREAEVVYQYALAVARRQHSKALELRTAVSLGRLWQTQGKREDARRLVAGVYDWFTEGFETPDLRAARALLAQLA